MKVKFAFPHHEKVRNEFGYSTHMLELGKTYNVLGIEIISGEAFYYFLESEYSFFPKVCHSDFFEIESSKLSRHWHIQIENDTIKLFFDDWLRNPDFMLLFIDPPEEPVPFLCSIEYYRQLIDREESGQEDFE